MQIQIPCETIQRIARIINVIPPDENREWLRSVFIERKRDHVWIGATNATFAAIQYMGVIPGNDGIIAIKGEALPLLPSRDAHCTINDMAGLDWCMISTTDGFSYGGDAAMRLPEGIETFKAWRDWIGPEATATGRAMFINTDGLAALANSSPSGRVVFPRIIDAEKPVIIRDIADPDWLGIFVARPSNGLFFDGATRPNWVA